MTSPESSSDRDAHQRGAGVLAVFAAITAFSWGFVIIKAVPLPPPVLAFIRLVFGACFLTGLALVVRAGFPRHRWTVIGAGLAFGAHQLIFIAATKLTSIAIVTTIGATQPLLVMLVSQRFVGESVNPKLIVYTLFAIAGVGIIVYANQGSATRSLTGDILAVINLVVFTTYFMFAKRAGVQGENPISFTAGFQTVALVVVAPAMLVWTGFEQPELEHLGLIAVLVLGPGNGHLLLNWAHARVPAALSALILAMTPMLASVWAFLVLGEPLTWKHGVGMAFVMVAIELGRRSEMKRLAHPAAATTT